MQSKPGKHGTLYRYAVTYTCAADPVGFGTETWQCWAYSKEHAEMKWFDSDPNGEQGWKLISVNRVKHVDT